MGEIVALALLLANPKTRDGVKTLLKFAVVLVALMIPLAAVVLDSKVVSSHGHARCSAGYRFAAGAGSA